MLTQVNRMIHKSTSEVNCEFNFCICLHVGFSMHPSVHCNFHISHQIKLVLKTNIFE